MNTVVKVAVGVFVALAFMFFVRVAYVNYVVSEMTSSITKMATDQQEKTIALINQQKATAEAQKRNAIFEQQEKLRIAEDQAVLERKKEEAWFKYYEEPKDCLNYKSNQHMVECTNLRMRAKREFERLWAENIIQ